MGPVKGSEKREHSDDENSKTYFVSSKPSSVLPFFPLPSSQFGLFFPIPPRQFISDLDALAHLLEVRVIKYLLQVVRRKRLVIHTAKTSTSCASGAQAFFALIFAHLARR